MTPSQHFWPLTSKFSGCTFFTVVFPHDKRRGFSTAKTKICGWWFHATVWGNACMNSMVGDALKIMARGGIASKCIDCPPIAAELELAWIHLSVDKRNWYMAVLQKEAASSPQHPYCFCCKSSHHVSTFIPKATAKHASVYLHVRGLLCFHFNLLFIQNFISGGTNILFLLIQCHALSS